MEQDPNRLSYLYADLGFPDAVEMSIKARIATKIGSIIERRQLTQVQAAEILDISQPNLSGLLRGQCRGISEDEMLEYLARPGR